METPEAFTLEIKASDLPESFLSRFSRRPAADTPFEITIEPIMSEAERLAALCHDLQEGLDASAAGRVIDGEEVFARMRAKFSVV